MRTFAEIDECARAIDGDGFASRRDAVDQLEFERLFGEQFLRVFDRDFFADEIEFLRDDASHGLLQFLEIFIGNARALGRQDVVVEAVVRDGTGAEFRLRIFFENSHGEDMGERVADIEKLVVRQHRIKR